jgi:tetratricopeptide (TPR) repeat protein
MARATSIIEAPDAPDNVKASAHACRADLWRTLGQRDNAFADIAEALACPNAEPDTKATALNCRSALWHNSGDANKASADIQTLLDMPGLSNRDKAYTLTNRGWQLYENGDIEGLMRDSRAALELTPTDALARFNLGFGLLLTGQPEAARVEYERAVADCHGAANELCPAMEDIEDAIADRGEIAGADATLTLLKSHLSGTTEI